MRKTTIWDLYEAKALKNKRNRLWKRYTRSQSTADHVAYTQARNALRTLTRNLRKQFERQIANNVKENPKAFWNYARNRMKTRPALGNIEGIDGKLYTSDIDKSNARKRARDRWFARNLLFILNSSNRLLSSPAVVPWRF